MYPKLDPREERVALGDVIGEMPQLRSRLSRRDAARPWQSAVEDAYTRVGKCLPEMSPAEERKFRRSLKLALNSANGKPLPFRDVSLGAVGRASPTRAQRALRECLCDEESEKAAKQRD